MKLETFFEKFDQFVDAPDAVARMREVVMWSAFSGAFSSEERNSPMPEEWAREGAPTLPAIPASWKWQRGSDVFDVIRGVSYKKSDASDVPIEGSFPLLRANNIGNGINFDELVYVPRDNIRDEQFVRRGDILIAMSSGSKKLVGKAAPIVTEFDGAFGAFCGIIRNKSAIPDEVLARYFQTPQYTSWVTAAGRGIGINNLGKGDLDSLPIPIPPLAEQKRIVAKVDELMALCDRLEAQQQEREQQASQLARASLARFADAPTPANLPFLFHPSYAIPPADLRKCILDLAVNGKLAAPAPDDGEIPSIEEFREAAASLANSLGLRSPKESLDEAEPPFEVPAYWRWMALADLGAAQTGTTPSKNDHAAFNGDIPFIKPADILPDGINYSNESLTQYGAESGSRLAPAGSLLMVCIGTIGKCNLIERECAFNQQINSLSPVQWVDSQYLLLAVRAPYFQEAAWNKSSSTTLAILNKGKWLSIPVPIPPLAEQRRIVAKVEQLMALVDELDQQLATSRATGEKLLAALVSELTAGKESHAAA